MHDRAYLNNSVQDNAARTHAVESSLQDYIRLRIAQTMVIRNKALGNDLYVHIRINYTLIAIINYLRRRGNGVDVRRDPSIFPRLIVCARISTYSLLVVIRFAIFFF